MRAKEGEGKDNGGDHLVNYNNPCNRPAAWRAVNWSERTLSTAKSHWTDTRPEVTGWDKCVE